MFKWLIQIWNDVWSNEPILSFGEEKEKLKNLTADEINEILIAKQKELFEQEANAQATEASDYFTELYHFIVSGKFEMDGKNKRLIVKASFERPSTIEAGKILQTMFKDRGYQIIDVSDHGVWTFGLVRDMGENAKGYFDSVYYQSGRSGYR